MSLPPSSEPIDSDVQVLEGPAQSRRKVFVLVPPLPSGFMKANYVSNRLVLNDIAQNDLSFNKLSPGTRRFALGLRPTQKRKRKPSTTPSPRKRVHKRPHREQDKGPSTDRIALGYCTEPVDGFFGTDPFDTLLEASPVDIGEEIPYNDMNEQDFLSLRISLRRTRPTMLVQEPSHSLSSSSQILASLSPPPETFGMSGHDLGDVQDFSYITPWSAAIQERETYGFSQPLAESSRLSTVESSHSETPYGGYFGNGTIDPSVLGGGPIIPPEQTPSPSPPPPTVPTPHNGHPQQHPTSAHTPELSRTSASRSPTLSQRHPPKVKGKVKPSQEILAAAGSIRRRTPGASSSGVRDRRPSTRVREALQQADYELTDDDADGETVADDDDFEPLASLSTAKRERSLSQGRPKPSRKSISTLKVSRASGMDVEGTYCHQCRCKTKGRKMQCAAYRVDDIPCELRFCERCITRRYVRGIVFPQVSVLNWSVRYPDLKFNPATENFICPKCSGYCNCTACCNRRGEEYISSRGNGPSPFLLLSQSRNTTALPPSLSSSPPLKSHSISTQRKPSTPALAVPPGMFWGTVYGVNGERIGAGVVSEDRQVIITNKPPPLPPPSSSSSSPLPAPPTSRPSRKIIYVGQPPRRKDTTSPPTVNGADEPEHNVRPAKRAFIGDKIALISGTLYKSLEEHFASDRASSPLTPIRGSSDPVQPTTVEVGFLLAQAMQQMGQ